MEINKETIVTIIMLTVLVCCLILALEAHGVVDEISETGRFGACKELGYPKYTYRQGHYCIDRLGFFHDVDMKCNFSGNKCKATEIRYAID